MKNINYFIFTAPKNYDKTLKNMEKAVFERLSYLWLLEHNNIYTAGIQADESELLSNTLPVYTTNRGGKYTYHGLGQRIMYVIMDLNKAKLSPKQFCSCLQTVVQKALSDFGIHATKHEDRAGLWVGNDKIMALGIRVRSGVAFHGIALNVCPDLTFFEGIVPCGLKEYGVTSLEKLGHKHLSVSSVDERLLFHFQDVFNLNLNALPKAPF